MPSVSRAGGVSPTASVSSPGPGTVNRGTSVSNGTSGWTSMESHIVMGRKGFKLLAGLGALMARPELALRRAA